MHHPAFRKQETCEPDLGNRPEKMSIRHSLPSSHASHDHRVIHPLWAQNLLLRPFQSCCKKVTDIVQSAPKRAPSMRNWVAQGFQFLETIATAVSRASCGLDCSKQSSLCCIRAFRLAFDQSLRLSTRLHFQILPINASNELLSEPRPLFPYLTPMVVHNGTFSSRQNNSLAF